MLAATWKALKKNFGGGPASHPKSLRAKLISNLRYIRVRPSLFLWPAFARHLLSYILFPGIAELLLGLAVRRDRRDLLTMEGADQRFAS